MSTTPKPPKRTDAEQADGLVSINLFMEESLRTEIRIVNAARGAQIKETVPYLLRLGLEAHKANQPK